MKGLKQILKDHKKWLKGIGGERADLTGADLTGADLRRANLTGADLWRADLREANLGETKIYQGNQHVGVYQNGFVSIGCEIHTLEYWLENYEDIGKKHKYTHSEIEEYGDWFKSLK